jgi:hypothetical protein
MRPVSHDRRRFLGAAVMTLASARLGLLGSATTKPGTNPSFGPLKQIDAGLLSVEYAEAGPADGRPVMLLHGWPYDIHSYADVAPALAARGYRAIVPFLRGYGSTRFRSGETVRNGQQSVLAVDVVALMEPSGSKSRPSPASIGARGRLAPSRLSGPSAARRSSR